MEESSVKAGEGERENTGMNIGEVWAGDEWQGRAQGEVLRRYQEGLKCGRPQKAHTEKYEMPPVPRNV